MIPRIDIPIDSNPEITKLEKIMYFLLYGARAILTNTFL